MVAVGYMDPGNWATDIAGGAQFGYRLLSVVLISNLFAILLQHLALKLGIATGRDLAQACRDHYSRPVVHWSVGAGRNCHCCHRSGRGNWLSHCAEPAVWVTAHGWYSDNGTGRVIAAIYLQNKGFQLSNELSPA